MVGTVGFEPTTCRLSGATGYKPAALPLSYVPGEPESVCQGYSKRLLIAACGIHERQYKQPTEKSNGIMQAARLIPPGQVFKHRIDAPSMAIFRCLTERSI